MMISILQKFNNKKKIWVIKGIYDSFVKAQDSFLNRNGLFRIVPAKMNQYSDEIFINPGGKRIMIDLDDYSTTPQEYEDIGRKEERVRILELIDNTWTICSNCDVTDFKEDLKNAILGVDEK